MDAQPKSRSADLAEIALVVFGAPVMSLLMLGVFYLLWQCFRRLRSRIIDAAIAAATAEEEEHDFKLSEKMPGVFYLLWQCFRRLRSRIIDAAIAAATAEEEEHDFKLSEKDAEDITLSGSAAKEYDVESAASDCPVCLARFREGDLCRRLRCSHIYRTDCINAWSKEGSNSCPICRHRFFPHGSNNSQRQPHAFSHV